MSGSNLPLNSAKNENNFQNKIYHPLAGLFGLSTGTTLYICVGLTSIVLQVMFGFIL